MIGDNPNKSLDCYPCSCPDCPGYHECDYLYGNLKYGEIGECDICGSSAVYEPLELEDIKDQYLPKSIVERLRSGETIGGKYVTLKKPHK